ncbi:transporter substrate-binding domain-containing protein (plasmid) [Ralstonia syzygii]|uniref:Transporter substrate-binding domain-containing protein n=1 Tax=Ralstonia syzygii TaxID=28097 RepID=A0ABX7ZL25_9RALS|nr:transporter substrate-binding domain-containing protein [Ralstonia syzygii]QUP55654.1 transporter substrate-binding domain-containing protein [Ralstonia syzygii]
MPDRSDVLHSPSPRALRAVDVSHLRRAGVTLGIAVLAATLLWLGAPRWIGRIPHVPERLPASVQAWLARLQPEPDWATLPRGPVLEEARRNGELVVAVRAYARPALPGTPAAVEPDNFDADLASRLAQRLDVGVRLVGVGADGRLPVGKRADLVIAGAGAMPAWSHVPTPYTGGQGRLVVLRNTPYRTVADLHARSVCVGQGSPYTQGLVARQGVLPQVYPSAIRAIGAFLAGECQALAEDEWTLARLLRLPEWRFYRTLDDGIVPDDTEAQIALRLDDPISAAYLDRAVRHWKTAGELAQAREHRAGDIAFEVGQLRDGLVCHN